MTIERAETVILSEKEDAALSLAQRIAEGVCREAESTELRLAAEDLVRALSCFISHSLRM